MLKYSPFFHIHSHHTLFPFLTLIFGFCCCLTSYKKRSRKKKLKRSTTCVRLPFILFHCWCGFPFIFQLFLCLVATFAVWAFKIKKTNRKTKILLWKMGKTKCNLYHWDYCLDKYDKNVKLFVFSSHELAMCMCMCMWYACVCAANVLYMVCMCCSKQQNVPQSVHGILTHCEWHEYT